MNHQYFKEKLDQINIEISKINLALEQDQAINLGPLEINLQKFINHLKELNATHLSPSSVTLMHTSMRELDHLYDKLATKRKALMDNASSAGAQVNSLNHFPGRILK